MRYEVYDVAWKIVNDEKRVEKLRKINKRIRRFEKAEGMITAVCREQKFKLTEEERSETMHFLHRRMKEYHGFGIF